MLYDCKLITIKLLGGAKKLFGQDLLQVNLDDITIVNLLDYLLSIKPVNSPDLDMRNILVAVNGVDSSALQGSHTILRSGDVISIIPIIHGGSQRLQFKICGINVELFPVSYQKGKNYVFLDLLRTKFSNLVLEGISSKNILSLTHAKKIIELSIYAKKRDLLLAKKLETDILLRFAVTTQISLAIEKVGIKQHNDFVIIAIGQQSLLDSLYKYLVPYTKKAHFSKNSSYVQKQFAISKKQFEQMGLNVLLEDLLAEKAAILVS